MHVKVLRVLLVGLLLAACSSPAPTRTAVPLLSPSAALAAAPTPGAVSPTPTSAVGQPTRSEVLQSGGASAVMLPDDVPFSALAFGGGYLLAGENLHHGVNDNRDTAVIWQSRDGLTWQRISPVTSPSPRRVIP